MSIQILILVCFIFSSFLSAQQQLEEMYENTPKQLSHSNNTFLSFVFQVSKAYGSDSFKDVIIYGNSGNFEPSNLEIFISTTPINLSDSSTYQIKCFHLLQMKPCVFSFSKILDTTLDLIPLYFTVACRSPNCAYSLKIYHISPVFLKFNKPEMFQSLRESGEIFNFTIPDSGSFDRVIFQMNLNTESSKLNHTSLIFSKGVPTIYKTENRFLAIFNSNDKTLCFNCNITVFLNLERGVLVELEVFPYELQTSLKLNKEYYDFTSTQNLYNITISKKTFDNGCLIFKIRSLAGTEKTLFVNPGFLPEKMASFVYNSTNLNHLFEYENDIEICQTDINSTADPLNIYLAVQGDVPKSPFYLKVQNSQSQKIPIKVGISENAFLKNGSLKYFELEIYKTEASEGKLRVFLSKYSNDFSLYMRMCNFSCALITEQDISNKNQINLFDEKTQDTNIEFLPKCVDHENLQKCFYLFAIKSKSKAGFFSLVVKRENSFIELIENRRHESHIEIGQEEFYRIFLDNMLRNIERISFLVSSDVEYEFFFANETSEITNKSSAYSGNSVYPVTLEKEILKFNVQSIIIKVRSEKSTFYWISAEVEREDSVNASFFIKAVEGNMFDGVLNSNFREIYLQYVNTDTDPVEIELIMRNEQGKIQIFVSESPEIPSEETNFLKSNEGFVCFIKNQPGVKKYNILIKPNHGIDLSSNDSSIDFDLTISTNKTLKILNKPGVLLEKGDYNKTKHFLMILNQEVSEISLFFEIPSNPLLNGLNLEIRSCDSEDSLVRGLLRNSDHTTIRLDNETLNKLCHNVVKKCEFFVDITSREPESFIYSLSIIFQAYSVEIKDSFEQKLPFNSTGNDFLRLFYYVHNKSHPIEVSLRSFYPDFETFIDILDNRKGTFHSTSANFPNNNSNFLHSQFSRSHYIRISEQDIQNRCWPRCVLLISIHMNPGKPIKANPKENPSVSILINGEFSEIPSNGKPQAFSLKKEEFRYCFLSLKSILKGGILPKNGSITFSLTHYNGEGGIYFKVSDNDRLPFPNDFDYFAYDGHITVFFKDLQNLVDNKMTISQVKIWLAVFCRSIDCEFTLASHISENYYNHIFLDTPLEVTMINSAQVTKYFKFKNTAMNGFKIKFNRLSGIGRLTYGFCDSNKEFFDIKQCFKNNDKPTVFFAGLGESHITVTKKEPEYCEFCDVAIRLENLGDLKGTLLVMDVDEFAFIQEGKAYYDSLESLETNKYRIMVSKSRETTVKVSRFSGNVNVFFNSYYELESKRYQTILGYDKSGILEHTIPAELDKQSKGYEVLKPVFILVTSQGPANYSIMFSTSQMVEILNYGLLEKIILRNNTEKSYFFHSLDLNQEKSLTIMVSDPKVIFISFLWRDIDSKRFEPIILTEKITTENSYLFPLPKENLGTYRLDLKNNDNSQNMTITMILNSIDAVFLPIDLTIHGILKYKSYKYYEVFIENPGYLVLDFKECTGSFEIAYTNNYNNLFLHEFDGTFTPITRNSGLSRLKINPGMIYFAIHAVNKEQKGSLFELTALYFDSFYEIPESQLTPGEEGRLRVFIKGKEEQSIGFWPLKCVEFCEEEEMTNAVVEYIAILSEKQGISKCGNENHLMKKVTAMSLLESNQLNKELDFEINTKKGSFYVSLRALVKNYRNSTRNFSLYYQELDLSLGSGVQKHGPSAEHFYFFLACFVVLTGMVCCFCGMQYWRKCIQGEQTLTYEMQDVRNVAQIRGVNETMASDSGVEIENAGKSYVGLVEE